jgi:subtilisin family serine protease
VHRALAVLTLSLALAAPALAAPARGGATIDPALARAFDAAPDGRASMLVVLAEQADLSAARSLAGKEARGRFVFETLQRTAARSQASLVAELDRLGVAYRPFWVANFLAVEGDRALAERLAARPDVARIDENTRLVLAEPVTEGPEALLDAPFTPLAIEWNLLKVNADDVWALGYTGAGAVIGGQDTGYDWDHPALLGKYRGWNGSSADHNYHWHDAIHSGGGSCGANSPVPCDDQNHGTHTMGTMVGDDGGANQIGMAPGAKWIGCRNMDQGNGTPATYSECFQWFIAPTDLAGQNPNPAMAPDVINNSWGCPPSEGCNTPDILRTVVENTRAAGIFVAVSAGNSGSSCSSVVDPPAIYDASFSVGSTTSTDTISSFSSRGPVTIDGSNRMKPDISAPGSGVRSSVPGTGYSSMSGTSMAGPHVAGLVALILSAAPSLAGDVDTLEDYIRQTAFHPAFGGACGVAGGVFPNNTFGAGRIDALAAVQLAAEDDFTLAADPISQGVCVGDDATFTVTVGTLGSFVNNVTLGVTGNPAGTSATFDVNPVVPPGISLLTVGNTGAVAVGTYPLSIDGTAVASPGHSTPVELTFLAAGPGAATLVAPANGATGVSTAPTLSWSAAAGASGYLVEVDDDANFSSPEFSATVAGTSTDATGLAANVLYHWRVTAENACGTAPSTVFTFSTTLEYCATPNLAIPDNGAAVTSTIVVPAGGTNLTDLDLYIRGNHSWVGDVIFGLSKDGGANQLHFDRPGVPTSTFGCSSNGPDITLDDESATPLETACPATDFVGTFSPNVPLSFFDGQSISGTWTLSADDNAGGDSGSLLEWCLVPTVEVDPMPFLADFEAGDLSEWSATQP